jgi:asparagine synthase (glutamine-hydrolysing)
MSAQAGIWNLDGRPVDRNLLSRFGELFKQRGPDGEYRLVGDSIALLYCPFFTTPEARSEKQPYVSSRGFVLTWDGRLDNRSELNTDLRIEAEQPLTDVAIIAAAFDRWDTDCFPHIIGDWAVSIWKPEQREIVFATDYLSIRHLFYYKKDDRLWWATDLTPLLLLSGSSFHLDDEYIAGYFTNQPDSRLTPYREICQVPAGHFVRIREGQVSVHRYWHFKSQKRLRYKTDIEYEQHFLNVFRQAVRRRLRADRPVLAELSGGLDSSSIVCVADQILAKEPGLTPCLDTLSFYNSAEPNADDSLYFQKIEKHRGRIGTHIDASKLATNPLPLKYDDFLALPGYLGAARPLEEERAVAVSSGHYRVVLSGIGGDEFLGGIPDPRAQLADLIVQFKLHRLFAELRAWSFVKRRSGLQLLWQSLASLLPASMARYIVREARVAPWIDTAFASRHRLANRQMGPTETFGFWLPSRRSYIAGLSLMARKMSNSPPRRCATEENRYPYLDRDLIEFLVSIPSSQLMRPGQRRSLMRRALVGIVPQEVLSRTTKQVGERTPLLALDKNWEELQRIFASPISSQLGYINATHLWRTLHAVRRGTRVHLVRLLRTVSFEFWLRDLVARGVIEPVNTAWPDPSLDAESLA